MHMSPIYFLVLSTFTRFSVYEGHLIVNSTRIPSSWSALCRIEVAHWIWTQMRMRKPVGRGSADFWRLEETQHGRFWMEQLSRPHSLQYPEGTHIADLTNQACINHVAIFVGSLLVHGSSWSREIGSSREIGHVRFNPFEVLWNWVNLNSLPKIDPWMCCSVNGYKKTCFSWTAKEIVACMTPISCTECSWPGLLMYDLNSHRQLPLWVAKTSGILLVGFRPLSASVLFLGVGSETVHFPYQ